MKSVESKHCAELQKKLVFIHIPKNAGITVLSHLKSDIQHRIHCFEGAIDDYIAKHSLGECFKFAFKRNPYDRFSSLYRYFRTMSVEHPFYRYNKHIVNAISEYHSLSDFALDFHKLRLRHNFHFREQCDYLYRNDTSLIVDYLGSVENLDQDIKRLARRVQARITSSTIGMNNVSGNWHNAELDEAVVRTVNYFYSRDLTMLGYPVIDRY